MYTNKINNYIFTYNKKWILESTNILRFKIMQRKWILVSIIGIQKENWGQPCIFQR